MALSLLAAGFAYRVRLNYKATSYQAREQELRYLSRGAVTQALLVLEADNNEFDAFTESWHLPLQGGASDWLKDPSLQYCRHPTVRCTVIDEESKVNVNTVDSGVLTALGIDPDVVSAILDWKDENDEVTWPGGAESEYYLRRSPPYRCKNKPFELLQELLLVKGVGPELFQGEDTNGNGKLDEGGDLNGDGEIHPGLCDLLTVYGDGLVNLNTASADVLASVSGVNVESARAFTAYRNGNDGEVGTADGVVFKSLDDLKGAPSLSEFDYLRLREVGKVTSEYFSIRSTASEEGTVQQVQIEATVRRTAEGVIVLSWAER
jgi:general secretion pathway protein K